MANRPIASMMKAGWNIAVEMLLKFHQKISPPAISTPMLVKKAKLTRRHAFWRPAWCKAQRRINSAGKSQIEGTGVIATPCNSVSAARAWITTPGTT